MWQGGYFYRFSIWFLSFFDKKKCVFFFICKWLRLCKMGFLWVSGAFFCGG